MCSQFSLPGWTTQLFHPIWASPSHNCLHRQRMGISRPKGHPGSNGEVLGEEPNLRREHGESVAPCGQAEPAGDVAAPSSVLLPTFIECLCELILSVLGGPAEAEEGPCSLEESRDGPLFRVRGSRCNEQRRGEGFLPPTASFITPPPPYGSSSGGGGAGPRKADTCTSSPKCPLREHRVVTIRAPSPFRIGFQKHEDPKDFV